LALGVGACQLQPDSGLADWLAARVMWFCPSPLFGGTGLGFC